MITPHTFSSRLQDALAKLDWLFDAISGPPVNNKDVGHIRELVDDFEAAWAQCCADWPAVESAFAGLPPAPRASEDVEIWSQPGKTESPDGSEELTSDEKQNWTSRIIDVPTPEYYEHPGVTVGRGLHGEIMRSVATSRFATAVGAVWASILMSDAPKRIETQLPKRIPPLADAIAEAICNEIRFNMPRVPLGRLAAELTEESCRACWQLFANELAAYLRNAKASDSNELRPRPILEDDPICNAVRTVEAATKRPLPPRIAMPWRELLQLFGATAQRQVRMWHLSDHLHTCATMMASGARAQDLPPYEPECMGEHEPIESQKIDTTGADARTAKRTPTQNLPANRDVIALATTISKEYRRSGPPFRPRAQIAREFTGETSDNDIRARSLLRMLRRYKVLQSLVDEAKMTGVRADT